MRTADMSAGSHHHHLAFNWRAAVAPLLRLLATGVGCARQAARTARTHAARCQHHRPHARQQASAVCVCGLTGGAPLCCRTASDDGWRLGCSPPCLSRPPPPRAHHPGPARPSGRRQRARSRPVRRVGRLPGRLLLAHHALRRKEGAEAEAWRGVVFPPQTPFSTRDGSNKKQQGGGLGLQRRGRALAVRPRAARSDAAGRGRPAADPPRPGLGFGEHVRV